MNWTTEQQRVIETRNRNILVSAAAGSGKTAVLVARVLSRILDAEDPVSIDELLIVTFTKAAAGEMRERITRALMDARRADPENEHLTRQLTRIHRAVITTIDGFCTYVLRNYGHLIGLAPGFSVAEEGEAALIREDVVRAVMEEAHEEEDPDRRAAFYRMVETFATGKTERPIELAVLRLSSLADSGPDPESFLAGAAGMADAESPEAFLRTPFMRAMAEEADVMVREGLRYARFNISLAQEADGPSQYMPSAEADCSLFEDLLETEDYEERYRILSSFKPVRLSGRKNPDAHPDKKDRFKEFRAKLDGIRKTLSEEYYQMPAEAAFHAVRMSREPLLTLLGLTRRFREKYREAKELKSRLDFSDLEHCALRVLRDDNGERTYAAVELSGLFREVMIDEYQDSNYLQEAILTAVSRIPDGEGNYFSVGDVKQSIYSFRQARPDLFMEKYDLYTRDPSQGARIDLHKNFRSRREVTNAVNGIFSQIMMRSVGGIDYDESARLHPGASYPDMEESGAELLLICRSGGDDGEEVPKNRARELEARGIGLRIRELIRNGSIYDRETELIRPVRYGDIVILLRTMSGWAETFVRTLEEMGIPAVSTAKSGYFTAMEVLQTLDYLTILDNPVQDIPFAASLAGPYGNFSAEELAKIRGADLAVSVSGSTERRDISLYEAARAYAACADERADAELREKLDAFFETYDRFRAAMRDMPTGELIYSVLMETGFYDYAAALPGGAQRCTNLMMLIDKAAEYERTSYIGLYNFVRYIENMKSKSQDFGEISAAGEMGNAVQICSIHRSKGLEYPVVFVSGLAKTFNFTDSRSEILMHPVLGIASNYLDTERRVKMPTLTRNAISRRMRRDTVGEELRILYVALTRAEQKVIMTGCVSDREEAYKKDLLLPDRETVLPAAFVGEVQDALSWILPAVWRMNRRAVREETEEPVRMRFILPSDLLAGETRDSVRRDAQLKELYSLKGDRVYDIGMRELLSERFSYVYPRHTEAQIPVEISISEIKRMQMEGTGEASEQPESAEAMVLFPAEEEGFPVPAFYRKQTDAEENASMRGTERGKAYHRVMELLHFAGLPLENERLPEAVRAAVKDMTDAGKLTEEEAACVRPEDIVCFMKSSLGKRMQRADAAGTLRREQPFVLSVPAGLIREEWPMEETVYVQGMIDAFFEENGGIILADYKTDRVRSGKELRERYGIQLTSYAEALRRVTGMEVTEKLIWSFGLGTVVELS